MLRNLLAHPGKLLLGGWVFCAIMFTVSLGTGTWSWFPRGGAMLGLAGFLVSGREILLYRSPTPTRFKGVVSAGQAFARRGQFGQPVLNPSFPNLLMDDAFGAKAQMDETTTEEYEKERAAKQAAWDDADDEDVEEIPGDEGYSPKDSKDLTAEELRMLRYAAIAGTVGTIIWAFGDLL